MCKCENLEMPIKIATNYANWITNLEINDNVHSITNALIII